MARSCSICASAKHAKIDAELVAGEPVAQIARRHKVSTDAVHRHKQAHLSPALAKIGMEELRDDSARGARADARDHLLETLRDIGRRADRMLDVAEERKSFHGAANLMREARGTIELIARLENLLDDRPQTTVVNVLASPEFSRAVGVIFEELSGVAPEVRVRIGERLEAMSALPAFVDAEVVE